MKKIVNGEYIEMTDAEYAEWKKNIDENPIPDVPSESELIEIILGGAS